jgi:hypothetical protein
MDVGAREILKWILKEEGVKVNWIQLAKDSIQWIL